MSKSLHDIDDLFRSALDGYEETPSARLKKTLDADLDKKDAESYKKRFIPWKRTAFLLLLLLAGFALYESGILKNHPGRSAKIIAGKKTNTSSDNTNNREARSYDKEEINNKIETNNTVAGNDNTLTQPGQKDTRVPGVIEVTTETVSKKTRSANKTTGQKNTRENELSGAIAINMESAAIQTRLDKNNDPLLKEKINSLEFLKKISPAKMVIRLANNIKQLVLPAIAGSLFKTGTAKANNQKKSRVFKPFWMITGFASYDQAGYKLDSDEPSAVSNIKYREAHEPSFSGGILTTRQLTARWGLQSGFIYANNAIGMKPQKTYAFQDPTGDVAYKYITSSGYAFFKPGFGTQPVVGDSLTTAEAKHTIESIALPLAIKYTMSGKKVSLTPGAGVEANFITKANLEVDIEDAFNREIVVVRKLNGTKSFYWSFVADAELRYTINKKMSVTVRPVYRHAITPITKNNVVETFPHSFGLGTGVTIKF